MTRLKVISSILSAASLLSLCQGCAADNADCPEATTEAIGFEAAPLSVLTPDGVTTTLNIPDFKVTATYKGEWNHIVLMNDVVVKRTGLNSWEYSPKVDWPGPPVSFYMVNPLSTDWAVKTWEPGANIWQYDNNGKTDLVVAADYDAVSRSGPLKVNFRHALAHVSASLLTDIPEQYELRIKFVFISGVAMVGHYAWPTMSTNQQNPSTIGSPENSGVWEASGFNDYSNYIYTLFGNSDPENEGTVIPDSGNTMYPLNNTGIQFMIPHKLLPSKAESWGAWNGANLIVVYRLINRSDNSVAWPSEATPLHNQLLSDKTWAIAPFHLADNETESQWLPGIAYAYRLTLHLPKELANGNASRAVTDDTTATPHHKDMEVTAVPY